MTIPSETLTFIKNLLLTLNNLFSYNTVILDAQGDQSLEFDSKIDFSSMPFLYFDLIKNDFWNQKDDHRDDSVPSFYTFLTPNQLLYYIVDLRQFLTIKKPFYLVIGPFLTQSSQETILLSQTHNKNFKSLKTDMISAFKKLPSTTNGQLYAITSLISEFSNKNLMTTNIKLVAIQASFYTTTPNLVSHHSTRAPLIRHKYMDSQIIMAIFEAVKTANLEAIERYSELLEKRLWDTQDDPNYLQQIKLRASATAGLICSATLESQLPSHVALTLMADLIDEIIQAITIQQVVKIIKSIPLRFALQVEKNQSIQNYSKLVQNVLAYLSEHYKREITMTELSSEFKLSISHLSRVIRQETGRSVSEHLHLIRINKAKAYLQDTEMSIDDISHTLGYCHASHFSRVFKKIENQTPLAYRKRVHK